MKSIALHAAAIAVVIGLGGGAAHAAGAVDTPSLALPAVGAPVHASYASSISRPDADRRSASREMAAPSSAPFAPEVSTPLVATACLLAFMRIAQSVQARRRRDGDLRPAMAYAARTGASGSSARARGMLVSAKQ